MDAKPKTLSQAIEELEKSTSGKTSELRDRLAQEIHRFEDSLKSIQPQLEDLQNRVSEETKKAKSKLESEVQKNPWAALGIVGLIFFVLGFLLARRGDN